MNTKRNISGFTLTEVLLALGIFTIGFSMMAMALPIAALMQKNTADGIYADIVTGQAKALIKASSMKLGQPNPNPQNVVGLDTRMPLNLTLGAFPSTNASDENTFGILTQPETRNYPIGDLSPRLYWVPLIRRMVINTDTGLPWSDPGHSWITGQAEWQVVIAVLKFRSQARYDRTVGTWAYETNEPATDPETDADPTNDNDPWQGSSLIPGLVQVSCSVSGSEFEFNNDFDGDGVEDVQPGQIIIDEFGGVYRVATVDPNNIDNVTVHGSVATTPSQIWYSPSSVDGGNSPILDVVVLTSNSQNQLVIDNKNEN